MISPLIKHNCNEVIIVVTSAYYRIKTLALNHHAYISIRRISSELAYVYLRLTRYLLDERQLPRNHHTQFDCETRGKGCINIQHVKPVTLQTSCSVRENLFVVVEDGVHILDPDGVDRSVEQNPLTVLCCARGKLAKHISENTCSRSGG